MACVLGGRLESGDAADDPAAGWRNRARTRDPKRVSQSTTFYAEWGSAALRVDSAPAKPNGRSCLPGERAIRLTDRNPHGPAATDNHGRYQTIVRTAQLR